MRFNDAIHRSDYYLVSIIGIRLYGMPIIKYARSNYSKVVIDFAGKVDYFNMNCALVPYGVFLRLGNFEKNSSIR